LLVPEKATLWRDRFVFSLVVAVSRGLPLITFVAAYVGWRGACRRGVALRFGLPPCLLVFRPARELRGPPLSLHSFNVLAHSRKIIYGCC